MIEDVKTLDFIIDEEEDLDFILDTEEDLEFTIDEFTQVVPDIYEGPYDVIPKVNPLFLSTADKYLKQNITVWGIPYEEVSNKYGTTVTIAE